MTIPSSIEAHLAEAGFTATELVILRTSLDGKARSLREIGLENGKSTGVLDQAMKKLLNRKIIIRRKFNGTFKYVLSSNDAVMKWMEMDIQNKTDGLLRKKKDIQLFMNSLEQGINRPKVEYFDGEKGIEKAYTELINQKPKELLQFLPDKWKEEEHPMAEIYTNFSRQRKRNKIIFRVITEYTPRGMRYKSRDCYEDRKTRLVHKDALPIPLEKIICGDIIACFNFDENRACFLRFPDLAACEREIFESAWAKKEKKRLEKAKPVSVEETQNTNSIFIRLLNLSRPIIFTAVGTAVLACAVTFFSYKQQYQVNTHRVQERVKAIAANSVIEFNAEELVNLQSWQDAQRPEYVYVIRKLMSIKRRNPDIMYAYIMRRTDDPYFYEFVADAESVNIRNKEDLNEDGLRNDIVAPGHVFFDPNPDISPLVHANLGVTAVDSIPEKDPWGTWISGHAPIIDGNGNVVATLGIDMDSRYIFRFVMEDYKPMVLFGLLYILFIVCILIARSSKIYNEKIEYKFVRKLPKNYLSDNC
ncbi:hypothetical protein HN512_03465 [Candidatus Peregrinibacteria bacterium]|jgi:hypothetical protein|nr:hypothetical protein [Candidatus Peregrinibacteria bacterium]MBT3598871.1 hypothetical protein [Candidatus Peregrinibacteria bacterium]MBT4367285.1 hypothetical protein [Candidatus Peregrinibacteria bacterium]MBT4585943.1 hypothetical protein [Candidatus Peregrinibacteria bacterium]MBT7009425.1 hypothetical protein [Candidatus Peregrinibacteria bacterium]